MKEFKTWASVVLFSSLGMAVLIGIRLPSDPSCGPPRRCHLDTMAQMQERIGDVPTAMILFSCALFSFFWYKLR